MLGRVVIDCSVFGAVPCGVQTKMYPAVIAWECLWRVLVACLVKACVRICGSSDKCLFPVFYVLWRFFGLIAMMSSSIRVPLNKCQELLLCLLVLLFFYLILIFLGFTVTRIINAASSHSLQIASLLVILQIQRKLMISKAFPQTQSHWISLSST